MIKAVIFDIDNTLYSYEHSHEYGMRSLAALLQSRVWSIGKKKQKNVIKELTRS